MVDLASRIAEVRAPVLAEQVRSAPAGAEDYRNRNRFLIPFLLPHFSAGPPKNVLPEPRILNRSGVGITLAP